MAAGGCWGTLYRVPGFGKVIQPTSKKLDEHSVNSTCENYRHGWYDSNDGKIRFRRGAGAVNCQSQPALSKSIDR
uniref:Uncharacterized protein n=1 Tax=Anopheles dirus TaxID=7168 RepID=A0A182NBV9_9DIPT